MIKVKFMSEFDLKKSILIISENKKEYGEIYKTAEKHFYVEYTESYIKGFNILNEDIEKFAAVLIDDDLVIQGNFEFLKTLSLNLKFSSLPVLIILRPDYYDDTLKCFKHGATDVLSPPYNEEIIINRIKNAIKLKDSMTISEIEEMLKVHPSNVFLKDREGKYIFATHYWHHLEHADEPGWSIRGKTDIDIRKDTDNAVKSMEADMEIIRTGKSTSYVLEMNTDGVHEFMQLIKRPVFDKDGNVNGIIGVINDVTELENLKRKVQQMSASDN